MRPRSSSLCTQCLTHNTVSVGCLWVVVTTLCFPVVSFFSLLMTKAVKHFLTDRLGFGLSMGYTIIYSVYENNLGRYLRIEMLNKVRDAKTTGKLRYDHALSVFPVCPTQEGGCTPCRNKKQKVSPTHFSLYRCKTPSWMCIDIKGSKAHTKYFAANMFTWKEVKATKRWEDENCSSTNHFINTLLQVMQHPKWL